MALISADVPFWRVTTTFCTHQNRLIEEYLRWVYCSPNSSTFSSWWSWVGNFPSQQPVIRTEFSCLIAIILMFLVSWCHIKIDIHIWYDLKIAVNYVQQTKWSELWYAYVSLDIHMFMFIWLSTTGYKQQIYFLRVQSNRSLPTVLLHELKILLSWVIERVIIFNELSPIMPHRHIILRQTRKKSLLCANIEI